MGLAVFCIFLPTISITAAGEQLDWWAIDSEVGRLLIGEEKNLIDWAKELRASPVKTPYDAVLKLNVCMRAGLDDDACAAVRTLWSLSPEAVDNYLLTSSYLRATDDYEAWDVARMIAETFAPRLHEITLDNRLFKHFRAKGSEQRWSDEEFIAWLDARVESVRRYDREREAKADAMLRLPRLDPWRVRPIDFWRQLRLRHLDEMGLASKELKQLAAAVRESPADVGAMLEYLTALASMRHQRDRVGPGGLDWMAEVCRPARATDLRRIASLLVDLEQCQAAETFFRRAIETKLTDEENADLAMSCQAVLSEETHRLLFQVGVREDLAKCLLKMDKAELSQRIMVEAANMRQKHGLPLNPYLSGSVQGASGAQEIEGRIRAQEKDNQDDPEYWQQRAEYFRGRGEAAKEESALRRGLLLCQPAPQVPGKGSVQMRYVLLRSLVYLLNRENRSDEASALLLWEMDEVPIDSASSQGAAQMLAYDLPKLLNVEEPILWNWLAKRAKWEHPEERLIWRMLESATPESRGPHFTRAENLALQQGADATRAATLGWILNRMGQTTRSTMLLKHAIASSTSEELKQQAAITLFESYLELKDWRAAESIFDLAEKRLTPAEDPKWLGRIALIAAEKGANQDAMRLFRRAANCNLRDRRLVDDLSKLGLKDELRAFYDKVRRQLPTARLHGIVD